MARYKHKYVPVSNVVYIEDTTIPTWVITNLILYGNSLIAQGLVDKYKSDGIIAILKKQGYAVTIRSNKDIDLLGNPNNSITYILELKKKALV